MWFSKTTGWELCRFSVYSFLKNLTIKIESCQHENVFDDDLKTTEDFDRINLFTFI